MFDKFIKKVMKHSGSSSKRKYRSRHYSSSSHRKYRRYSSSSNDHKRSPFHGSHRYKRKGYGSSS